MSYTVPLTDQIGSSFLFTISEQVYPSGRVIPTVMMFPKNLDELGSVHFRNLKIIAKRLNIPGRSHMNKNMLTNEIRQRIIFE